MLHAAGVTVAIRSKAGGPASATNGRNLPYEAATAVAFGLPEDVALKAVTLTPAQVLGVADRVGSLETGKCANLVVTAGNILQPTTSVLALFIEGKPVTPESRHTQLYAKYQRRLLEVKAGVAPLGLERLAPAPARLPTRAAGARLGSSPTLCFRPANEKSIEHALNLANSRTRGNRFGLGPLRRSRQAARVPANVAVSVLD